MKKLFLFLMLVVPFVVFAQQNTYKDIVELKNGSVIKGIIIEQIPNQQIKIQTADGSLFVFQIDEIAKLRKEVITEEQTDYSQQDKGYIGISLGTSFPVGDGASNVPNGVTLSVIDFGYRFPSNIGIGVKWFASAYLQEKVTYAIGGLMGGVLGIVSISEKVEFINRALIGFEKTDEEYDTPNGKEVIEGNVKIDYDLGIGMKFNVGRKIALLANFDYIMTKGFNRININGGVVYRL